MAAPLAAAAPILKKLLTKLLLKYGPKIMMVQAIVMVMAILFAMHSFQDAAQADEGLSGDASAAALADIPAKALELYRAAAKSKYSCPGVSWALLAAIGKQETDHGRSTGKGVKSGENSAGAMGPMQFIGGTWSAYGVDGDGDGTANVYNLADAIYSAANYLCNVAKGAGSMCTTGDKGDLSKGAKMNVVDNGGQDGQIQGIKVSMPKCTYKALHGYNQSSSYIADIWHRAEGYLAAPSGTGTTNAKNSWENGGGFNAMNKYPPRTPKQALAWAAGQVSNPSQNWTGMCLYFVSVAYLKGGSGAHDAYNEWVITPAKYQHPGDTNPPAGALMFWSGGSKGYGHAALSAGGGMVYSTDIGHYNGMGRPLGKVDLVKFTDFAKYWGNEKYLGWADPYFPMAAY